MLRLIILSLITASLPALAAAQERLGAPSPAPVIEPFRPMPFHELAEAVADRYEGQLLAAQTRPPNPRERDQDIELIYEFTLMTPQRNLVKIRMDARTGRFVEVAGRGQVAARRPAGTHQEGHD